MDLCKYKSIYVIFVYVAGNYGNDIYKIFLIGVMIMRQLNIPDIDLKKELSKCDSMEDLVGKNG